MTKIDCMVELQRLLSGIPNDERLEIIDDLEEHFQVGKQQGKSEEDII